MSAALWRQFMDEVAAAGGFAAEDGDDDNDLPLLLYTRPRGDGADPAADGDDDIAYIALDEGADEIVTNVCLDHADPENGAVLLDLLEQNGYVFQENDAVFSLTPDGSAVTVSVRHPLRLQHAPEWLSWLGDFMDSCRQWNENLRRLSLPSRGVESASLPLPAAGLKA
ncbi:MAG: type III secretion system chaperone [Alphaproteobacteria bacterium]|nr:type III secretion system chaperone [Alphaproteobacteria bacterium]MDA8004469.1 type III secretion system chaperone [Alphaproteobacteria bacterium]MDA8005808.1 type III secretion system chaperone [Alphaproteobacteria bacterium]MDA8013534.1 type III secretion system chaperone [Alphaproteobacteria bacterium]